MSAPEPDLEQLLAGIDQGVANELMEAFRVAAADLGVDDNTAMWALAQLEAAIIANGRPGREQSWRAQRFREMVYVALPVALTHYSRAQVPQ